MGSPARAAGLAGLAPARQAAWHGRFHGALMRAELSALAARGRGAI